MRRYQTAVLLSGSGSNFQALANASLSDPSFPAQIKLVISNVPNAGGLKHAMAAGIKSITVNHLHFSGREPFDTALQQALDDHEIEFVCLAGFMRILGTSFAEHWSNRMLNIHPSLLPAFRGNRAHEQVIASSVALSGCTVHAVTPTLDDGPIVGQVAVRRLADDTVKSLSARVHDAEHCLYPLAVRAFLRAPNTALPEIPTLQDGVAYLNSNVRYLPAT